jgi:hypothetical protein
MYDIFIKNGPKESFIKLEEEKIIGYSLFNGTIFNITKEELEIVNSLKMGNNTLYLGKENNYDVYIDNYSGLKHYFLNGKESLELFIKYNTEDALLYHQEEQEKNNASNKVFKMKLNKKGYLIIKQIALGCVLGLTLELGIFTGYHLYVDYQTTHLEPLTYETICNYFEENDRLEEYDKEILNNEKLLTDVTPYYNGTNMEYIVRTRFKNLHYSYYKSTKSYYGYYNSLFPNVLNIKQGLNKEREYATKCHEYIHLLQCDTEYTYIIEACAELITYEYLDSSIDSYYSAVKNIQILMEIIGPEPIWRLNFAGDDTKLINILKENLSEEKAEQLINLLKEKPYIKNSPHKEIRLLLEELYYNKYQSNMDENIYIKCLKEDMLIDRYYFNSEKILENNPCYLEGKYVYDIKKELTYEEYTNCITQKKDVDFLTNQSKIQKVWIDESLNGTIPIKEAIQSGKLKIYYHDQKVLLDTEKKELLEQGCRCYLYGPFFIDSKVIEIFCRERNNRHYQNQLSERCEIKELPNIYENFPNEAIDLNNRKNKK